jgi:hypothetical protein
VNASVANTSDIPSPSASTNERLCDVSVRHRLRRPHVSRIRGHDHRLTASIANGYWAWQGEARVAPRTSIIIAAAN